MNVKKEFFVDTPILFLIFNRIETVKKVFEEIRIVRPKELFLASDGPRNEKESKEIRRVREYVLKNIDWKCDVKKRFLRKNRGCKSAVSSSISWFFRHVNQGIILEDDCLPNQDFFRFCEEMLKKYKNKKEIMSVSGQNPLGEASLGEDYFFSKFFFCWGWATWRDRWEKVDFSKKISPLRDIGGFFESRLHNKRFEDSRGGKLDSWATTFVYYSLKDKKLHIIPSSNLVENIGFLKESTHTKENFWDQKFLVVPRRKMKFPIKYRKQIREDTKLDNRIMRRNLKRVVLKKCIRF